LPVAILSYKGVTTRIQERRDSDILGENSPFQPHTTGLLLVSLDCKRRKPVVVNNKKVSRDGEEQQNDNNQLVNATWTTVWLFLLFRQ
jgi:hypothetical protein